MIKKISHKKLCKSVSSKKETPQKMMIYFLGNTMPEFWPSLAQEMIKEDGAEEIIKKVPTLLQPVDYLGPTNQSLAHSIWNSVGYYYRINQHFGDAKKIYIKEYEEILKAQAITGVRIHKGTPLCWTFDSYMGLGNPALAKRFIMLTLCEDAIENLGIIPSGKTGVYFRLSWHMGMADFEIRRYASEIWALAQAHPNESFYPEWLLNRIDDKWKTIYPTANEMNEYVISVPYVQYLLGKLGDGTGASLEHLAEYLLSCIPGCRAKARQRTKSTDYDVVGVLEGNYLDFRSQIDRYFVCECKDWKKTVNSTTIYKFASVLRSISTNFGIIFSKKGISGKNQFTNAEREQVKIYQRDGIVIIVLDQEDLIKVSCGENFISIIREKYERARLDLRN